MIQSTVKFWVEEKKDNQDSNRLQLTKFDTEIIHVLINEFVRRYKSTYIGLPAREILCFKRYNAINFKLTIQTATATQFKAQRTYAFSYSAHARFLCYKK